MDDLERKAEILLSSPPKLPEVLKPQDYVDCGRCKKKIHISEIRYHWTGICQASDSLCTECQRLVPKHALVVCLGCKAVVARMAPMTLKSGFRIETLKIYHTDACPNCKPGVESTKLIEAEIFRRNS
jgi:hypothetical protein